MPARIAFCLLLIALPARADDWPQWMGPKRDNVWREEGIVTKFPEGGPKVLWRVPVAGGYAGPAVANGMVFVSDYVPKDQTQEQLDSGNFDRTGSSGTERVLAFTTAGKEVWKYEYPTKYAISYPSGPRCTPTVHEGKVYTLGAEGHLACLDAATGKKIWAKELKETYKTKSALWGYAAHPLIDGQKLITLAGREGSHVVALDIATGDEIWKSQSQTEQGYSPAFITEAAGVRQLIIAGPDAVRGLDPETGKRLWTTEYNADNGSMIMTPVRSGDYLYIGGYRGKNLMLKMTQDKPGVEVLWRNKKGQGVSPVNVQPFLMDGVLYGYDDTGDMYAVEIPSGKRLWQSGGPATTEPKGSETAFLVKNGDLFYSFAETGELVICKLSPKGYETVDRAKVIEQTNTAFGRKVAWCAPAFAGKKMYVRNDKELICIDLAK